MSMAVLNYCMAMPETHLCHVTEWHGRAKIEHGRARHRAQQKVISYTTMPFSCVPMPDLCDSPRDDNFQLKFR